MWKTNATENFSDCIWKQKWTQGDLFLDIGTEAVPALKEKLPFRSKQEY